MISTSHDTPVIEGDYMGMSAEMAYIAWNEILARHGYVSEDQVLMEYFVHQSWYRPNTPIGDDSGITLSEIETENIRILQEYQEMVESQGLDTEFTYHVSCNLYTVTVPAYWEEYGLTEKDTGMLRFREKHSKEIGMGGHVFTLNVYENAEQYDPLPSWELLGTLTDTDGKTWHLVAIYPTDVQFDLEDAYIYMRMSRETPAVLETIQAGDGCTFTPA